jgi:acyl-CoA reductase-like NAD-dependent aldehyde dehydrogenase
VEVGTRSLPLNADQLDRDVDVLRAHAEQWARLAIADKIVHLRTLRSRTIEVAAEWALCAAGAKGIAASPLAGEEWLSGPYALLVAIDRLIVTLSAIASGSAALPAGSARLDARGRVAVDVFPLETSDRLLLSGVRATVVMQPGVTLDSLAHDTASFYANASPAGRVTLVLGAGNIASIGPLDVLTALYAHGSVALLKLNPVNAYLEPFFVQIFGALIDAGFVRIRDGGADTGAYLTAHDGIDAIHLTGGERTHDAIVFGIGDDAAARKRASEPLLRKPVTSELGNVTPVIVVPGPWSNPDIAFQAAHVATMKMHNAGANCIAAQILITSADDARTPRFVAAVRDALAAAPARPTYYPGSLARQATITQKHPNAETLFPPGGGDARTFVPGLDATDPHESLFTDEAFGPVLGQTSLPGADAATFLRNAVAFCNNVLHGTLGASILIHPRSITELGSTFDEIVADLRYGSIAINAWPGVGYLLATASWGAYPGNTIADVGSGIGIVHNACLFDRPATTIVRAPFAPFPRSLGDGEWTLLPTPPWFVNHHRAAEVGRRLFAFTAEPSPAGLAATAIAAFRG